MFGPNEAQNEPNQITNTQGGPRTRYHTVPNDAGLVSASFDVHPTLFNCERKQPSPHITVLYSRLLQSEVATVLPTGNRDV
jgi:hypothetical protein